MGGSVFLPVVWPETKLRWGMETSFKRSYASTVVFSASTHTSASDSWTLTGKSDSVSYGVSAPFSWLLVCTVLFVSSKNLFLQTGGSAVIKCHWPPKLNPWGISASLPDA